ncbi:MAG: hypothetical protein H6599_00735 [Flavobacteriales bacterium]|nr:hypothetical protein [Flavobacteriales bacterium]
MKLFLVLINCLIISLAGISQFDPDSVYVDYNTYTSYNSVYKKKYRAGGNIITDTNKNKISEVFECCYDDTSLFYYQKKMYIPEERIKYDSIVDLMGKKKAKMKVLSYNEEGKVIYKKILTADLNSNRKDLPSRKEVFWYGKIIRIKDNDRIVEKVDNLIQ